MRILRYDTGICPRCKSQLTARLSRGRDGRQAFHCGSPVVYSSDPGKYNCTCIECGVRWTGTPKLSLAGWDKIQQLKIQWLKAQTPYDAEEEKEILDGMAEEMGLTEKKKPTRDNPGKRWVKYIAKETISSPIRSLKSLGEDLSGTLTAVEKEKIEKKEEKRN